MPRYRCGPDHGHVTCCGGTDKYCSVDGYCSTTKHANNQDDYSECNNVCNECNDDCKKCCDTFFPISPPGAPDYCEATPGANSHFCLCGSADPFQSRGCGVDAPPMKDDESWVSPDEFDDIDAWVPDRPFVKMTCSGWEDMTEEVDGWTVPISAEWDGNGFPPPEIKGETLGKNADGAFSPSPNAPCGTRWDARDTIQLACPIACGVTPEVWLDMFAQAQYPARYYYAYLDYDFHHTDAPTANRCVEDFDGTLMLGNLLGHGDTVEVVTNPNSPHFGQAIKCESVCLDRDENCYAWNYDLAEPMFDYDCCCDPASSGVCP